MIRLSSPEETAAQEAPATDELREGLLDTFRAELDDRVVGSHLTPGDTLWVRVAIDAWREAGLIARDKLHCSYFCFLSAIDWLPSPYGKNEDTPVDPPSEPEPPAATVTGYAGGDTRFQVFARVMSPTHAYGIILKADVPDDDFAVDTWIPVYPGANWHEREAYEMFGIRFRDHPNLVPLYLPSGFEGHPLRKDFPLLAREVKPWPGVVDVEPMPDEADDGESESEAEEVPS